jgi:hypothetical protein
VIKPISLVIYGLAGWAICGATIGIGRQLLPMNVTLIVHAAVAPLAFGFLTWRYFRRFPKSSPGATALAMLGIVIGLDALVVAPFLEGSYEMFRSVMGTWVPFALILVSSYLVARAARSRTESGTHRDDDAAEPAHAPDGRRS